MQLYLLTREETAYYDEYDSKLIRAKSQKQAREIANENVGDEGKIWDDKKLVKSTIIVNHGEVGVVIESFNAG